MIKTANLSPCGQYRYLLTRRWGDCPGLLFIMLNPSTADAWQDDATIRKCIGFAKRLGYESIEVVNLFAFRATKPKDMFAATDPIGPRNEDFIMAAAYRAKTIICAWGPNASKTRQPLRVMSMLRRDKLKPKCLHITQDGSPGHPLMLSYDRPLLEYS